MARRFPVRHQYNKQLLGFVYFEDIENLPWVTAIDDGQKLHTGLRIPNDASQWEHYKKFFGYGCLVLCTRSYVEVPYSFLD